MNNEERKRLIAEIERRLIIREHRRALNEETGAVSKPVRQRRKKAPSLLEDLKAVLKVAKELLK